VKAVPDREGPPARRVDPHTEPADPAVPEVRPWLAGPRLQRVELLPVQETADDSGAEGCGGGAARGIILKSSFNMAYTRPVSGRRWVGVSVLLAWCSVPTLDVLSAATADPHAAMCSGHVCQCRRQNHCPPKRTAAKDCHETPASSRPSEMTSRCNHESDPLPAASRSDSIQRPTEELTIDLESRPALAAIPAKPEAGHTRLDPQPPRLAS
jgi:hypothetical protein